MQHNVNKEVLVTNIFVVKINNNLSTNALNPFTTKYSLNE